MSTQGPNSPATTVNDATVGTSAWTNPNNVQVSDGAYAVASFNGAVDSGEYIKATNYGFSIPGGATINGIVVNVQRKRGAGSVSATDTNAKIVKGGTIGSTNKALAGEWPTTEAYATYGTSSDLWGLSWTPSDINSSGFGFAISSDPSAFSTESGYIDYISITVYYTEGTKTLTGASTMTGVNTITL